MFSTKPFHRILASVAASSLLLAAFFVPGSVAAQSSPEQPVYVGDQALQADQPVAGYDYNHDISTPFRDIPPVTPAIQKGQSQQPEARPLMLLPNFFTNRTTHQDPVVQNTPAAPDMPTPILNFDGIPFPGVNCNCAPPDTNGEVGLTQYVQIVNEGLQVFDKSSGSSVFGPVSISTLWSGFGDACEFGGAGDPVVVYDQLANRWVVTQFATPTGGIPITDECIAVSTTGDATGSYARYGFHLGSDFFDYPKFGVWPDAYYMSMNVFNSSGTAFLGPQAFAFDRSAMLAGNPATFIAAPRGNSTDDAYMPADLDGLNPPPAGAPNPFLSVGVLANWPLYRFHVDFANPANSTFTLGGTLTHAPFSVLFQNVPQLDTGDTLDSLADRGMFRSAYRNFGDHEALVGNMTVSSGGVAGIRWFEVNNVTSGAPSFVQESTYQPDSTWRWMGSAAMDGNGNLALGFSASDSTIHPQIRYAGRLAGDPANTLAQGEEHLFDGTGSQLDTVSRWGDYSDMTVDPVDDCTFWYTQEYYSVNSSFNWRTRIGNFKFPTCTTAPSGTLQGTVTDSSSSSPIAGAQINVAPIGASTVTDASGNYSLTLPIGSYDVTASSFGYSSLTATGVAVNDGATTVQDFALTPAPSHTVSGHVFDGSSNPMESATVTILGVPIPPTTTDATGFYSFANVPEGTYNVNATAGGCNDPLTQQLVVNGDETLDFSLPQRSDSFGYFCQIVTPNYTEGTSPLALSGDDNVVQVSLPFSFSFYGQTYNTAFVATNGYLNFLAPNSTFTNSGIPSTGAPNGAIYPYWDDMFMDGSSSAFTLLQGAAPNRSFVIEWRNVAYFGDFSRRVDFEVILYENGRILTQYRNIAADGREQGNSATLGIENETGTIALQYSFNTASIESPDFAVLYRLPPSGFIQGNVTDANDHLAIAGASVKALQGGNPVRTATTDANGFYRMQVPVGTYNVEASAPNYATGSAQVIVAEDQTVQQNFALATARAVVSPGMFEFIVPAGQTRTRTLNLSNTGGLTMVWEMRETGGGAVTPSHMQGLEKDPNFDPNARTTEGLYVNPPPKGWSATAPGDVLTSWVPAGFTLPWGVGFSGNVWLSDPLAGGGLCGGVSCHNEEFTITGTPTGRDQSAPWATAWNADMALDTNHNAMCQVNVGGDNGIYCWDLNDGHVIGSITSGPWAGISQRGLAYRPDDNSFYIGGWNEGILYHIQGLGSPNPGAVISQCSTPDPNISGLAWNSAFNIIWVGTNSPTDTIYELNPDTCGVLTTLPHPTGNFSGGGLEMDDAGNLWMVSQANSTVYLLESGVPAFVDVPWLSETPSSGNLAAGGTQQVQIKVNTAGLAPGIYNASIFVLSNSARQPSIRIPVSLIVPAYYQGVNAGGKVYTDLGGDSWAADKAYASGSWGYMGQSSTFSTKKPIAGTLDDKLYQDLRSGMLEYRFDNLPPGVYQVDLRFAELSATNPGKHLFDVMIEGNMVLPALDIASEVGSFAADDHVFYVVVTDGQLNIRFITRKGFGNPIVNALRVVHRPDR